MCVWKMRQTKNVFKKSSTQATLFEWGLKPEEEEEEEEVDLTITTI